jgi:hypothetical protein
MKINNYDTSISFWELYPQLKKMKEFKPIYVKDKTRGKLPSSSMMWAFAAYVDISKVNTLRNETKESRLEIINEDFLGRGVNLDLVKDKPQLDRMTSLLTPGKQRVLLNYLQKLEERSKFIEDTKYSLDTATTLDKLIGGTDILFDAISKIEANLDDEDSNATLKGGRIKTVAEKKLL